MGAWIYFWRSMLSAACAPFIAIVSVGSTALIINQNLRMARNFSIRGRRNKPSTVASMHSSLTVTLFGIGRRRGLCRLWR